jgi:transposase-like protein
MSRKQQERREQWRQQIAQQELSKHSIRAFCRERGINEHTFYTWRQRLREQPVSFALVDTKSTPPTSAGQAIEIILVSGDRLRVTPDAATLRLVLNVLRETPA